MKLIQRILFSTALFFSFLLIIMEFSTNQITGKSIPQKKMAEIFSVPMFFVLFRETLEAAIIVSILLSFIERMELPSLSEVDRRIVSNKFKMMVWLGTGFGLLTTFIVGGTVITIWYTKGKNIWDGAELLWESVFGFVASIFITITAISMLKSHELTDKLQKKLARKITMAANEGDTFEEHDELLESRLNEIGSSASFAFFWIPLLTVVREGVEALIFVGGVAISESPSAIPLAALCGLILGLGVGAFIHYGGSKMTLHYFFVISCYILLIIASGLLSKSVGLFEDYLWSFYVSVDPDAADVLFFNPTTNIWVLPCCGRKNGWWGVMSALFGWKEVATIGTITTYISFWVIIVIGLVLQRKRDLKSKQSVSTENQHMQ
jgi:high-affinity iron transporter